MQKQKILKKPVKREFPRSIIRKIIKIRKIVILTVGFYTITGSLIIKWSMTTTKKFPTKPVAINL